jgi:hypothetical protein
MQASVAQNKFANRVLEFLPAPGQFTNEKAFPAYATGDDAATMAAKATNIIQSNAGKGTTDNLSTISLGAWGGYIIVGFDHAILNKPYAYDFKVHGNWFDGNAESGVVMVSRDVNGNGLADDPWYEIAGSEAQHPATVHNYEVKYYRPVPLNGNVRWTDNRGGSGLVLRNTFHTQESYYPLWFSEDTLIYRGTRLIANAWNSAQPPQQYWRSESFGWGYADNQSNAGELTNFDIDWAVDVNGNRVKLEKIDFIKVYTGMLQDAGWLGETSTEFSQAEDLHPDYVFPPVFGSDVHIVKRLPALPANTAWSSSDSTSFTDDTVTFKAQFDAGSLKDGFTYSNESNSATGMYTAASGSGTSGAGSSYIVGFYDKTAVNNQQRLISFNDGLVHGAEGVYVNNTRAVVQFLRNAGIRKGDVVKLVAKGIAANGSATGTKAEFRLADFSFQNSVMFHIVEKWCWMDLSSLGSVSGIEFTLEANRPEILPAAFCLDRLVISILSITQQPVGNPSGNPKICSGGSYTLTTAAMGNNMTYQWYKNGQLLAGATNASLSFTDIQVAHAGSYYCVISNGINKAQTRPVPLVVNQTTRIAQNLPGDRINVPQATVVSMPVIAEGDGLSYRWFKNTPGAPNTYTQIASALNASANTATLVPAAYGFVAANNGKYFSQITGTCGVVRSDTTEYIVVPNPNLPALAITGQPRDTTICFGNTVSFDVQAAGATSYNWYKKNAAGGFALVPNSQSTGFANPAINVYNQVADGDYRVSVTQDLQTINSREAHVSIVQKLAFVQPAAIDHLAGYQHVVNRPITMEVKAVDFTPTGYQWYYKGTADTDYTLLTGQTNAIYELPNTTFADAGRYRCVVTGAAGTSIIEYNLTVVSLLRFQPSMNMYTVNTGASGTQRANGLFTPGENLYLSSSVLLNLTNYTATWYKDGVEVVIPIANQDQPTHDAVTGGYWKKQGPNYAPWLLIKNVQPQHAGVYTLKITDATGLSEISTPVTVIINPQRPEITQEPNGATVNEDETVTLSITADGKGFTPVYQWHQNGLPVQGGTLSPYVTSGPTKPSFAVVAKPLNEGSYYCVITTPGGADTSATVTVAVNRKVRITSHPADQLTGTGKQAVFTVVAEGNNLGYQWKKNGADISQANSATLTLSNVKIGDEGAYTCVVTGGGELPAISGEGRLSVIQKPVITGQSLCGGEANTVLRVQTQIKSIPPRYQWYRDGVLIAGATSTWINVTNIVAGDTRRFHCIVANSNGGSVTSDTVGLITGKAQFTTDLPAAATMQEGDVVSLQVAAKGSGLTYQWYKDGNKVDGATNALFSFTAAAPGESVYMCKVSNGCGEVSSQSHRLTVLAKAPVITSHPQSQSVIKGATVQFSVTATGSGLSYQWFRNGVAITGATAATFSIPVTALADSGSYHCVVRNTALAVTSSTATLTVNLGVDFMVFPNPAQDHIWVKAEAGKLIVIYDLRGNKVHQRLATHTLEKIYVQGWMKGVYQVQIMGVGKERTLQFIKL